MKKDNTYLLDLFKKCIFNELSYNNYEKNILCNLPKNFIYDYEAGATKLCIIPLHFSMKNLVLKIPFSMDSYNYNDDYDAFPIVNANNSTLHSWDYCFTENVLYRQAKKDKVANFFVKTKLLGFVNHYPIYIQEKADTFESYHEEYKGYEYEDLIVETEEIKKTKMSCSKNACFNVIWLTEARLAYGEKKFNDFMNFISDYGIIDDLHDQNIGYINDKPVIFDYGGYFE